MFYMEQCAVKCNSLGYLSHNEIEAGVLTRVVNILCPIGSISFWCRNQININLCEHFRGRHVYRRWFAMTLCVKHFPQGRMISVALNE